MKLGIGIINSKIPICKPVQCLILHVEIQFLCFLVLFLLKSFFKLCSCFIETGDDRLPNEYRESQTPSSTPWGVKGLPLRYAVTRKPTAWGKQPLCIFSPKRKLKPVCTSHSYHHEFTFYQQVAVKSERETVKSKVKVKVNPFFLSFFMKNLVL